jgi:cysteinyl-tRNA synthetase
MARFWIHNEFVLVDGGKMSKSLGNVYTITDLELRGFKPLHFRYLCLLTHYRTQLNFTFEGLEAAKRAYQNLVKELAKHKGAPKGEAIDTAKFKNFIADDLNTPQAIALVWDLVKQPPNHNIYQAVIGFDKILSLDLEKAVSEHHEQSNIKIPAVITKIAEARQEAKSRKDFAAADKLREEIKTLGYEIKDTKDGYNITKI